MRRICLCLLILIASASAAAREVKLSGPDGGSCADTPVATSHKSPAMHEAAGHDVRVRPSVHGDMGIAPRMRWHSFLPGMFR